MLKMLAKKGKSNKGFTLIELIVVIAIIAILALLLVPRFAGFTEDARVSNDQNACRTLERAFMTLIANGTIRVPAASTTVSISSAAGGGAWTALPASGLLDRNGATFTIASAAAGDNTIEGQIEELTGNIEVQARTEHTTGFAIVIGTDGTVTCTVS